MELDEKKKQESDRGESRAGDKEKWVHDSSLDYEGRVPLRASTGTWKASIVIIGMEFAERLCYFSIGTNLIMYLTRVLQQDLKTATKNANYWWGVTAVTPLLGGFLADAYVGRFLTILPSSVVYVLALVLLTMSRVVPSLKPCDGVICREPRRIHEVVFFVSMYLISLSTGGHRSALESFGADQFDDGHPQERKKKMSFFNWWNAGLCSGMLLGVTVIVYIEDHVSFGVAYIILIVVMMITLLVFCVARQIYRFRKAWGSPLTPLLQVIVAAIAKRKLPYPLGPNELHELYGSSMNRERLLAHTDRLKFLDKAAIIEEDQSSNHNGNPWRLVTVTQVEELKLVISILPIWLTALPFGICQSTSATFFIKQAVTLDRKITNGFTIPPASMAALVPIGMISSVSIIDKALEPFLRKITKKERGITILQRIGIGMGLAVVAMVTSALVERNRLTIVDQNPLKSSTSMSVFWLAPQFVILGIGDSFSLVGLQECFYDQVPDSMRSLGILLSVSVLGASSFLCNLLITIVDHATEKAGMGWFKKDLNSSRVDYFYWLLAGIMAGDLCIYIVIARWYSYKSVRARGGLLTMSLN